MKTMSIRNILVPVDFSPMSIRTIGVAKSFAQRFGASVHLAYVHEFFSSAILAAPAPPFIPYSVYPYDQQSEKSAARRLAAIGRQNDVSPVTTHVLAGARAFDQICRLAKNLPADLIIMPTHGRTGLKHVLIGSTAERIVQHSPCPVVISKNGASISINTIVVPVDFSDCSRRGLNDAIIFAKKVAAKVIVLHVIEPECQYVANAWAMYDVKGLRESREEEAARQMQNFLSSIKFGRVEFESAIETGHPVSEIAGFARNRGVDLIITSTHGRTGLKRVLLGSTAEQLVRSAPCSVLVLPSHPEVRVEKLMHRATGVPKIRPPKRPRRIQSDIILTRKHRKIGLNPFPERRKTNKFRESHLMK